MSTSQRNDRPTLSPWRMKMHEVIFEAETWPGKAFDITLLLAIVLSVFVVMLDSVEQYHAVWGQRLLRIEWVLTLVFTLEYILRLACVQRPLRYATSFFGVIDLLAVIPTYLSLFVTGTEPLIVIRTLRLIRVFRVLELGNYASEAQVLLEAFKRSRAKIVVFLLSVLTIVMIMGVLMYLVEGRQKETEFTSIPRSVYWAIVTMTTVGYGDIAPQTGLGQAIAAVAMIVGYSIIIVPMGIFSAEVAARSRIVLTRNCPGCSLEGHDEDAIHCKRCGTRL